jgi:hypothetical protein
MVFVMNNEKAEHSDNSPPNHDDLINSDRVKRHAGFVADLNREQVEKLLCIVQMQRDRICSDKPSVIGDLNDLRSKTVEELRSLYAEVSTMPF